MAYVVLARKWRPSGFADIVGQEAVSRTLQNAIQLNRVSHAILFTGTRGVGKTTTARILAKALNCEEGPTTEPCGQCSNCKEIAAGSSVDVFEIDGASNTKVDEIRELLENVQYRPSKCRYKIYIIDEVHMLSTHSFNALLKTLEEPPPGVMFIFATTEPQKIPDTILSRCQRFDLRQISGDQIDQHLRKIADAEKIEISDAGLSLVSKQALGSLRDALSLFDQLIAFSGNQIPDDEVASILGLTDRALISRTVQAFVEHQSAEALNVVQDVFEKGYDPKTYLIEVWENIRDLLVLKSGGDERLVRRTTEEIQLLREWSQTVDEAELERWFDLFKRAVVEVGRSEFPRYLIEVAFLKASREEPRIPLQTLVERLEKLQSGGRSFSMPTSKPTSPKASTAYSHSKPAAPKAEVTPAPKTVTAAPQMTSPEWEKLVAAIKRKKPALAAILLQATPDMSEDRITLHYDEGSFYLSRAQDQDFQAYLTALAKEIFGGTYRILVKTQKRTSQSSASTTQDRSHEKEALSHPVIQKAVSLFGAKVEEIKKED